MVDSILSCVFLAPGGRNTVSGSNTACLITDLLVLGVQTSTEYVRVYFVVLGVQTSTE